MNRCKKVARGLMVEKEKGFATEGGGESGRKPKRWHPFPPFVRNPLAVLASVPSQCKAPNELHPHSCEAELAKVLPQRPPTAFPHPCVLQSTLINRISPLALSVAITDASAGLALTPNPTPKPASLPCGRGDENRLVVSVAPASPAPSASPPSSSSSPSPFAEPPSLAPLLEFSTSCRSYQEREQNLSCRVCEHVSGVRAVATEGVVPRGRGEVQAYVVFRPSGP